MDTNRKKCAGKNPGMDGENTYVIIMLKGKNGLRI